MICISYLVTNTREPAIDKWNSKDKGKTLNSTETVDLSDSDEEEEEDDEVDKKARQVGFFAFVLSAVVEGCSVGLGELDRFYYMIMSSPVWSLSRAAPAYMYTYLLVNLPPSTARLCATPIMER